MTLIAKLLSPMFFGLSASARVGVMAGEEVTDSWQSKIRKRWSLESLQLYKIALPMNEKIL